MCKLFAVVALTIAVSAHAAPEPPLLTILDLKHKISRAGLDSLLAQQPISDSTFTVGASKVHHFLFSPVNFEGRQGKLNVVVCDDSVMSYLLTIPKRGKATFESFTSLHEQFKREIGEPSVYSDTYMDYMVNGIQTIFSSFKDGEIFVTIIPMSK